MGVQAGNVRPACVIPIPSDHITNNKAHLNPANAHIPQIEIKRSIFRHVKRVPCRGLADARGVRSPAPLHRALLHASTTYPLEYPPSVPGGARRGTRSVAVGGEQYPSSVMTVIATKPLHRALSLSLSPFARPLLPAESGECCNFLPKPTKGFWFFSRDLPDVSFGTTNWVITDT